MRSSWPDRPAWHERHTITDVNQAKKGINTSWNFIPFEWFGGFETCANFEFDLFEEVALIITVDETSSHGTQNRSPSDEPAGLTIERLWGPRAAGPGREH